MAKAGDLAVTEVNLEAAAGIIIDDDGSASE